MSETPQHQQQQHSSGESSSFRRRSRKKFLLTSEYRRQIKMRMLRGPHFPLTVVTLCVFCNGLMGATCIVAQVTLMLLDGVLYFFGVGVAIGVYMILTELSAIVLINTRNYQAYKITLAMHFLDLFLTNVLMLISVLALFFPSSVASKTHPLSPVSSFTWLTVGLVGLLCKLPIVALFVAFKRRTRVECEEASSACQNSFVLMSRELKSLNNRRHYGMRPPSFSSSRSASFTTSSYFLYDDDYDDRPQHWIGSRAAPRTRRRRRQREEAVALYMPRSHSACVPSTTAAATTTSSSKAGSPTRQLLHYDAHDDDHRHRLSATPVPHQRLDSESFYNNNNDDEDSFSHHHRRASSNNASFSLSFLQQH